MLEKTPEHANSPEAIEARFLDLVGKIVEA